MKLKTNRRYERPVRVGWRDGVGYFASTIVGTADGAGPKGVVYFAFASNARLPTSEEECRLRSEAEGIPLLDITGLDVDWLSEDPRIIAFVEAHNPGSVEEG